MSALNWRVTICGYPPCEARFEVATPHVGQHVRCPRCMQPVRVVDVAAPYYLRTRALDAGEIHATSVPLDAVGRVVGYCGID